jgi:hypothetical protein
VVLLTAFILGEFILDQSLEEAMQIRHLDSLNKTGRRLVQPMSLLASRVQPNSLQNNMDLWCDFQFILVCLLNCLQLFEEVMALIKFL